jgi:hypothetical protein
MRKRMMLVVLPLCVVAVAASVAFAAPPDAEHSDAKLDNLHAERPTAALTELPPSVPAIVEAAKLDQALTRYLGVTAYQRNLELIALGDYLASLPAAPSGASPSPVYSSGASNGDFLACVRQRESGGDYSVYNAGGSGAAGAYQFLPGTWNSIAAAVGRTDLVGVDPAQASPADQDAMAAALYAQQGSAPWGGSC